MKKAVRNIQLWGAPESGPAPLALEAGPFRARFAEAGAGQVLLNHRNRRYLVSVAFSPSSARLTRTENGKTVDAAEMRLDNAADLPLLLKQRRDRIVLVAGTRRASLRLDRWTTNGNQVCPALPQP